jgi:membrane-associated protease RseP (regulator of RpoE activity)
LPVPFWQLLFPVARIQPISDGLTYSVPLMLILLCHEFGHYFVARAHHVHASLPHFIPLPPLLGFGTMGAVIGMRQVTSDRRKLIDIGAAGPLAGLLATIPVIIYGLSLSPVGAAGGGMLEGNSVLYALLKFASKGEWLPNALSDVHLHPIARAGWTGLLITMINLLPWGQLDGGHIAFALFGDKQHLYARWLRRGMLLVFAYNLWAFVLPILLHRSQQSWAAAASTCSFWLLWYGMTALMARVSGSEHPPFEPGPLGLGRKAVAVGCLALFVLLFLPTPLAFFD